MRSPPHSFEHLVHYRSVIRPWKRHVRHRQIQKLAKRSPAFLCIPDQKLLLGNIGNHLFLPVRVNFAECLPVKCFLFFVVSGSEPWRTTGSVNDVGESFTAVSES